MNSVRPARRVVAFPAWRENPYISITYLATISRGHDWYGATELDDLLTRLATCGDGDVLHLHWTAAVCQAAKSPIEARARRDRFVAEVTALQARGGRLLWTIHNRLPHDLRHRDLEIELCQFLADVADCVHAMSPSTIDMVSDVFALDPQRVVVVPHPSYQGLYADRLGDRERARLHLGIDMDRHAVLFFGQMRPYKGLQHLFDAFAKLAERQQELPVLLLAGSANAATREEITAALPEAVDVVRDHRHIPEAELPLWFSAADLAVFPYTAILNSGSVHLSATMGVPVVLPGEDHLREQFGSESWVRFYDPQHPGDGIATILAESASYVADKVQMREFSDRLAPWRVSRQIADVIDAL